jgi:hypothetical protein
MPTVTSHNRDEFMRQELERRGLLKPKYDPEEARSMAFQSLLTSSKKYKKIDDAIAQISVRFNINPQDLRNMWKAYNVGDQSYEARERVRYQKEREEGLKMGVPPPNPRYQE